MNEREDTPPQDRSSGDRIPVLKTPATPDEVEAQAPPTEQSHTSPAPEASAHSGGNSTPFSDEEIAAMADSVLDRLAPVLHDALVDTLTEHLSEHDDRRD